MRLRDVNSINLEEAIKKLEEIYTDLDFLTVVYWEDEDCREQGIDDIHMYWSDTFPELIKEAKWLVDKFDYACVEIHDDNGKIVYFYDWETEEILA